MIKEVFRYIYRMSIPSTIIVLILVCCLWSIITRKFKSVQKENVWKFINAFFFILWIVCVVHMTLFSRSSRMEINLIPFHFITDTIKIGNEEIFRTGWMNIILFVPGGMLLSYVINKPKLLNNTLQIIFLMLFSILIEVLQWHYQLGVVETDDVICNTIGAIIGVISIVWTDKLVLFLKQNISKFFTTIK